MSVLAAVGQSRPCAARRGSAGSRTPRLVRAAIGTVLPRGRHLSTEADGAAAGHFPSMLQADLQFLLFEMLDVEGLMRGRPRFRDHDRDVVQGSLDMAARLSCERFANHSRKGDLQEPRWDGGKESVPVLIPEVREACQALAASGLLNAHGDYKDGGLQLPFMVTCAMMMTIYATNVGSSSYSMLTIAAGNLLKKYGSPKQKELLLAPMTTGAYFGTMNLSEPSVGSSLGDITTSARPVGDGVHYLIAGSKMWISGGDHDLGDNIVVRATTHF